MTVTTYDIPVWQLVVKILYTITAGMKLAITSGALWFASPASATVASPLSS